MGAMFQNRKFQFVALLIIFTLLCVIIAPSDTNILWRLPPLIKGLPLAINESVDYLMTVWLPIDVYDPEIDDYEQKPLLSNLVVGSRKGDQ